MCLRHIIPDNSMNSGKTRPQDIEHEYMSRREAISPKLSWTSKEIIRLAQQRTWEWVCCALASEGWHFSDVTFDGVFSKPWLYCIQPLRVTVTHISSGLVMVYGLWIFSFSRNSPCTTPSHYLGVRIASFAWRRVPRGPALRILACSWVLQSLRRVLQSD